MSLFTGGNSPQSSPTPTDTLPLMPDLHEAARRHEKEEWADYMQRQFSTLHRRLDEMTDALSGIAEDEAKIAEAVPALAAVLKSQSTKLGELEAKIAQGETVDPAEVASIKSGLDQQVSALEALVPAAPEGGDTPAAAPKQTVYTTTPGATPDPSVWPPSGFETVPAEGQTALPLYYFSGDTTPTETNGNGQPEWTQYTGAVQAVPASV